MHCNKMKNKKRRNNNTGHFMHCNKKSLDNNTGHFMHCNKKKNKKPRNNNTGHFMHCNKKPRNNNTGHFMHWYFLQEMHFLVLITVHEMPCIVIPRLLITVHEMPCIVIPSFLILLLLIILFTELLRLIQLEPLNLETSFKLCCVGLV